MKSGHKITKVLHGSIAEEMEIEPGDVLLAINNCKIKDIFDYHYYCNDEYIVVLIEKPDGEEWEIEIEKDFEEDLGIEFEESLMDHYRSCTNKCMFCFIDQMPPGMRETLYFKDDDARLSFLQGNYITLTNMSNEDLERIILYKLSPVNVSIQTMNPELRCKMLHNRFAGEALKKVRRLYEGGIEMNSQIVLCKGVNDGKELDFSIRELMGMYPYMRSLSVVPFGKTKYREGLVPLEKFNNEESAVVLGQIHKFQQECLEKFGTRFVFASDEWYITAGLPIPEEEYYEGYGQIENGVGMVRSFLDEVVAAVEECEGSLVEKTVSAATGVLAGPLIEDCAREINKKYPNIKVNVYVIRNEFFGEEITVAGLITGQDLMKQLKDVELGEYLLLPDTMLRSGESVFLDDYTVSDVEKALQIPIRIVKSDGAALVRMILEEDYE